MPDPMMPCFWPGNAEAEGIIIGRILTGYGELEFELCRCLEAVYDGNFDQALKTMFRNKGGKRRLDIADKAMRTAHILAGLGAAFSTAVNDLDWCRNIRNQYAHCSWYYTSQDGLCFTYLEKAAKKATLVRSVTAERLPINAKLLIQQEDYFRYVQRQLWALAEAYQKYRGVRAAQRSTPVWPVPPQIERPALHN